MLSCWFSTIEFENVMPLLEEGTASNKGLSLLEQEYKIVIAENNRKTVRMVIKIVELS